MPSSDIAMTGPVSGLRLNYNPPVAPPADYQPPYFPPPYSIPQAPAEFQHQHQYAPAPGHPPHHFDPYRVYQHQQPHHLMPQAPPPPPINGHHPHHPHHHQQPAYYHHPADRYLFGNALQRGGFVVPTVPAPEHHELRHDDAVEYMCGGGSQPAVAAHGDPVSPTSYKDVDADPTLTTSCLRLLGDSDDRDQVYINAILRTHALINFMSSPLKFIVFIDVG